jgi:hypothetical protein
MTRAVSKTRLTGLPASLKRSVAWNVDRRRKAVREFTAHVYLLGESLGGYDNLPPQKQWLIEDCAYWHQRLQTNRAAVLSGRPPTLTAGEHQNGSSTMKGHLKDLGLERLARNTDELQTYLARTAQARETP